MTKGYWYHSAAHSDLYLHIMAVYPCSTGYKCKVRYLRKKDNTIQYIGKAYNQFEYVTIRTEDIKWWKRK
jgi:hypothetical protein